MCDKLVFDLSQEVEGSPNVFVRKDWINILDNQNQNYSNNQSIIDTSQLSNSNKYMSYRESYLAVPMLLTIGLPNTSSITYTPAATTTLAGGAIVFGDFGTATGSADYTMGLKNWFGTMIHSLTLDYNGTTVIQQTPYVNMWNSFKLMTSLSYQDLLTQGSKIGFYPDDATSFQFFPTAAGTAATASSGTSDFLLDGVCNNTNLIASAPVYNAYNNWNSGNGNVGFLERQQNINFNTAGKITFSGANTIIAGATTATYGDLLQGASTTYGANTTNVGALTNMWKSYVLTKISGAVTTAQAAVGGVGTTFSAFTAPVYQINIMATIMLKHLHSFFNMAPLLKGVFMKLTLNLNNTSTSLVSTFSPTGATGACVSAGLHIGAVSNAVGGVNPLMIASPQTSNGGSPLATLPTAAGATVAVAAGTFTFTYIANISVGSTCLDNTLRNITGVVGGNLAKSIYLYVPAYTFNPVFEQAYLSTPVKQIKYTDIYQYQITNVSSNGMINNLITNGIANIKSVLVLPYYSPLSGTAVQNLKSLLNINPNTNILSGIPVFQSPYDPAGAGCTSPLCHITNFNVQISGQNAIYNLQKYNFEQFNNQLYGQNAVNGGLTDGLTSGLIGRQEFDMEYCYYYVNVERMLPVEQSVPKSVQIIGQNLSSKACDYYVFVEYGVEISIDVLTGARV
jgi:hypothetical protein